MIADHLRKKKSITTMEALVVHKIPRLAARIEELRERGWGIDSVVKRDQAGARFVRYTLAWAGE